MPTTIGRWLSLASIPAGVLLVLAWLIPVSFLLPYMSAPDVRAVAGPAGNLALLNHWLTLGLAVLICVAFPAIAQAARGGWAAAIGATLYTLALFLIGVENLFAIARVKHVPEDVRVPGDVGSGHRMGVVRLRGVAPPRSGDRVESSNSLTALHEAGGPGPVKRPASGGARISGTV